MKRSAYRDARPGELVAYDLPPGPRWAAILAGHAETGASFLPVDHRLTEPEKRRVLERARPSRLVTPDEEVVFVEGPPVDPDRAWAVVATSGTGGEPKLAELGRAALKAAVDGSLAALGASPDDLWICCMTPAHVGGLLVVLRSVLAGAPLLVHERFDAGRLLAEAPIGAHVSLVPTMVARLVATGGDLSRLGVLLVGGAALDPSLRTAAAARGARVVATYGMTETCGGVVYDGVAFAGSRARIADDGAIEVHGQTLFDGYRSDPPATAAAFTVDGWLRTGDLGSIEDGRLLVHGRADDAIRTGAETVWPGEVEGVLATHPKVADVAVAGRPDPDWGRHVAAWILPADPSSPPTLEELRALCRVSLAGFKAPRELILVDSLPRTPSGKIRRAHLPPA